MDHADLLWLSLAADFADITDKNSAMLFESKQWQILENVVPDRSGGFGGKLLCFRSPAIPSLHVVPRRFDGNPELRFEVQLSDLGEERRGIVAIS